MIASPTIAPGQRVIIRIVATIARTGDTDYTVDYLGSRFLVSAHSLIAHVDGHMALLELSGVVVRITGRASFLVNHAGHALRVHEQQIRLVESEALA